jgi:hypothetical protein
LATAYFVTDFPIQADSPADHYLVRFVVWKVYGVESRSVFARNPEVYCGPPETAAPAWSNTTPLNGAVDSFGEATTAIKKTKSNAIAAIFTRSSIAVWN